MNSCIFFYYQYTCNTKQITKILILCFAAMQINAGTKQIENNASSKTIVQELTHAKEGDFFASFYDNKQMCYNTLSMLAYRTFDLDIRNTDPFKISELLATTNNNNEFILIVVKSEKRFKIFTLISGNINSNLSDFVVKINQSDIHAFIPNEKRNNNWSLLSPASKLEREI